MYHRQIKHPGSHWNSHLWLTVYHWLHLGRGQLLFILLVFSTILLLATNLEGYPTTSGQWLILFVAVGYVLFCRRQQTQENLQLLVSVLILRLNLLKSSSNLSHIILK